MKEKLDAYEKNILGAFEKDDLKITANLQEELNIAKEAARNTLETPF
jgi:hypothetical protein